MFMKANLVFDRVTLSAFWSAAVHALHWT